MSISDRELQELLLKFERRLDALEADVRRLTSSQGRWDGASYLQGVSAHRSDTREMFLLEILRQKGLLDGLDLDALAEKVHGQLASGNIPWNVKQKTADNHLREVLEEIRDNYDWDAEEENS